MVFSLRERHFYWRQGRATVRYFRDIMHKLRGKTHDHLWKRRSSCIQILACTYIPILVYTFAGYFPFSSPARLSCRVFPHIYMYLYECCRTLHVINTCIRMMYEFVFRTEMWAWAILIVDESPGGREKKDETQKRIYFVSFLNLYTPERQTYSLYPIHTT